jgi:hypothetical protein
MRGSADNARPTYLHKEIDLCFDVVHCSKFGFALLEKVFFLLQEFLLFEIESRLG